MSIDEKLEGYFKAKDLEKIHGYREKLKHEKLTQEKEERKKLHHMHCPKCGAVMQAVHLEAIEIDKCPECLGIYFDNEELERLLEIKFDKRRTLIHRAFGLK